MIRARVLARPVAMLTALMLAAASVSAQDTTPAAGEMETMSQPDSMVEGIVVIDAWTRASTMVDLANAVYALIHNGTDEDDALVAASSPAAGTVEIHQTSADAEGMMAMTPVSEIPLPAHADTLLEPGGYHLMLIGLERPLAEGDEVEVTFEFAAAEPRTVMVPARATGPMAGMDMDDMSDGQHEDADGSEDEAEEGEA